MKPSSKPPKQLSFANYEFSQKKRVTRREKFLVEMEQVVPWGRLEALIEPKYPSAGRVGRQPVGVARMLRMYCLQQCGARQGSCRLSYAAFGCLS